MGHTHKAELSDTCKYVFVGHTHKAALGETCKYVFVGHTHKAALGETCKYVFVGHTHKAELSDTCKYVFVSHTHKAALDGGRIVLRSVLPSPSVCTCVAPMPTFLSASFSLSAFLIPSICTCGAYSKPSYSCLLSPFSPLSALFHSLSFHAKTCVQTSLLVRSVLTVTSAHLTLTSAHVTVVTSAHCHTCSFNCHICSTLFSLIEA